MTKYEFLNLPKGTLVKTEAIYRFGRVWLGTIVAVHKSISFRSSVQIQWCDGGMGDVGEEWAHLYEVIPAEEAQQEAALAALMDW